MGLYSKNSKLYATGQMEIYIPKSYFESNIAFNRGATIETFGICYLREFDKEEPGPIRLLNIPTIINLNVYSTSDKIIEVKGRSIDVLTLEYLKDSAVMHQSVTKGKDIANNFLSAMLNGKIPKTLHYNQVLDVWWHNLEISGITYKVPSKIYEMIIASIYRNPHNQKQRYGQFYGKQTDPDGFDYSTASVRNVVKNLSTFSGMIFEDISSMISNGLNNNIKNIEEPESPLEKIIHY